MDNLLSRIDDLHLEDLRNDAHPSLFDENPEYDMLIIRLPVVGETLQTDSFGFLLTEKSSYYYDRGQGRLERLGERFNGPYRIIDPVIDRLLRSFAEYQERVADMEELLYADRAGSAFMTEWLGLKRDILRIERVLLRTSATLKEVIDHYEALETFPVNHYMDLHEHTDRIMRSALHQLSKLDYLYNFHNARTNEKMNRLIYLLTVISAIFLPLNLVVGFFGMNTSGLPFTGGDTGTLNVGILMALLLLATSLTLYVWHKIRVRASE